MTTPAPQSATTKFFQRQGGTLAYDDQGSGPLIVAVPGLGDLRQSYRWLSPRLVAAGYRVVTLDPRGQGESSARWPEYSPAAIGDDIGALIDHLGSGPATLIGNSYGGGAAVWTAAQRPSQVARLILIGAFVRDPKISALQRLLLKVLFTGPWKVAAWMTYFATLFKGGNPSDTLAYRARLRANLHEPGRYSALQAMLGESRAPIEAKLGQVQAPTLVLMGRIDPDFTDPVGEAKFIAGETRGELALLDGAGHYPQAERPDVTADAVLKFLAAHPDGR